MVETRSNVDWTVDELARRADLPVRTIRDYQTMGLLPPPEKRGRVGFYGDAHLARLGLIARLRQRGYSLAGIGDLLASWREGADLGEVLGLAADQLVHIDEPGAPASLDQLARLVPALVPDRLDELLATGVVESCGPDRYCVPSPSLVQLTIDMFAAGIGADRVIGLLTIIGQATGTIAEAVIATLGNRSTDADVERVVGLATRGRGLLAHGTGRLTIHTIGRRLGIADDAAAPDAIRQLLEEP